MDSCSDLGVLRSGFRAGVGLRDLLGAFSAEAYCIGERGWSRLAISTCAPRFSRMHMSHSGALEDGAISWEDDVVCSG